MSINKPSFHFNTRFFLGMNAALLLGATCFLLVPIIQALTEADTLGEKNLAAFLILFAAAMLSIALLYAIKKRDISWVESLDEREGREKKSEKSP
jgi:NADH:ubiquinone oxidoreductase subunit 3 (subunit A)